jgi:glycosyltransferase involved in cell wall biosynthesis
VKKILFISYDGMTDPLGQSQVIPYLQGLSKNGCQIFLLSCEKKEAFEQHRSVVENMLKASHITWIHKSYTKTPPALSTWIDIQKLKKAAKKIHEKHSIDLVHTRPGVPALVGLWMKKNLGVKFLHDIREFYAASRVEGGMWKLKNPMYSKIYEYFIKKEKKEIEYADGIVTLTYAAEKIVRGLPEFRKETPLEVIPCSADLELFDPSKYDSAQKNELKRELGIDENDLVISYLGSVGGWYMVGEMMGFFKLLIEKRPNTKFLFISPHRHDTIVLAASKFGIPEQSVITTKASRTEVPKYLSLSDHSIFFIKPCYSKQSSSPTKHGEIMAMGIPLITNSGVGDVEEIVNRYESGIVLNEFTNDSYSVAIEQILSGKSYDAARIRNGAKEFYSLENANKKYSKIYSAIFTAKQ